MLEPIAMSWPASLSRPLCGGSAAVIQQDPADLPALAHAGPVPDEEAFPLAIGERLLVRLPGIDHRLKLRERELPVGDELLREVRDIRGDGGSVVAMATLCMGLPGRDFAPGTFTFWGV